MGQSADTPQFAVEVIAEWWQTVGRELFPTAFQLLILGDAGGSNIYCPRMWKERLQEQLADRLGLEVMVCHYPTGASKWNYTIRPRLIGSACTGSQLKKCGVISLQVLHETNHPEYPCDALQHGYGGLRARRCSESS